jgi:alpha-tubulin suppressor-like RCC1 family protein
VLDGFEKMWCWGRNQYSQIGHVSGLVSYPKPIQVQAGERWQSLSLGSGHTCAITNLSMGLTPGRLFCWGANNNHQLGGLSSTSTLAEVVHPQGIEWRDVDAGSGNTCAIDADSHLWCWGNNNIGQLGLSVTSTASSIAQPQRIDQNPWAEVEVGYGHICAHRADNDRSLWCWGDNRYGQLGDGQAAWWTTPQERP